TNYTPEPAIAQLIDRLDRTESLISPIVVDDAKRGWTVPCEDVNKLATVHFQMRTAPSSPQTREIFLEPEDYTAYSDTQGNICRILFGALDPKISGTDTNSNYWIMGKPYFRTYYTEIFYDWKFGFARMPDDM
ncbi:hypothetical protein FOL47_010911, partial [Perkinsus chesapeaki]